MTQQNRMGAARQRVLDAAVVLFVRHGVNGTSLQMIADEIGVTKAAVYYQFRTKEEIVLAVITPPLMRLGRLVEEAERQRSRSARAETVLEGIIGLVVEHRRLSAILQSDPAVLQLLRSRADMQEIERRVTALLAGPDPDPELLVGGIMVTGGLMLAAADPRLAELDDESLRRHLMSASRRVLRLRAPISTRPL